MTATITVHGGLTAEPELRYTQNGKPVANGTVASTDRYLDKQSGEWRDGKKLYVRWSAWNQMAENIAASGLDKGTQVAVTGKLHTREFEDREGNKRTSTELEVFDFAVSVKKATAQVVKNAPRDGVQQGAGAPSGAPSDGWATAPIPGPQAGAQQFGGGGFDDSPF